MIELIGIVKVHTMGMLIYILFMLLFLFPTISWANGGCSEYQYISKNLYIGIDVCSLRSEDRLIMFTDKIKKDGHPDYTTKKIIPFQGECSASYIYGHGYVDPVSISCSKKGHTPLAGATFKLKHTGPFVFDCGNGPVEYEDRLRYACVSGCTKSVPKFLDEVPRCD